MGSFCFGKLARTGRAEDASGFVLLLTLARIHRLGRGQDSSGFVLFA